MAWRAGSYGGHAQGQGAGPLLTHPPIMSGDAVSSIRITSEGVFVR